MKRNLKGIVIIAITIAMFTGMISCENDLEMVDPDTASGIIQTKAIVNLQNDTIESVYKFRYKGETYETSILIINDSILSYKDKSMETFISNLYGLPNLVTFFANDGYVEYFDDRNELYANLNRLKALSTTMPLVDFPMPRILDPANPNYSADLYLYDDHNYNGKIREFYLEKNQNIREEPQLRDFSMNDKTTSFVAHVSNYTKALFELFEDDTYRSHCFAFILSGGTSVAFNNGIKIFPSYSASEGRAVAPDLKDCRVEGTNSSWNDRITSFRITRQ